MAIVEGLDPKAIHESGWGMVLPAELDKKQVYEITAALEELLDLRKKQAGNAFRIFSGQDGVHPGESASSFLKRHGVRPGPVNPNQIPYYLLIVADPSHIPLRFQTQLDVQYAVGRIWFEYVDGFEAYAKSVRRAEGTQNRLPARLTYFCPRHPDDAFTQRLSDFIRALSLRSLPAMQIDVRMAEQASKADLIAILNQSPPRVMFAAGHGLIYPAGDDPYQATGQGGLVCADWPGPSAWSRALPQEMCFQAQDVPGQADLNGMIYIQYSSYSLGTVGGEGASEPGFSTRSRAPQAGALAHLPQRLLGMADGRGALAALGWVDRLWAYSGSSQASRELAVFESSLTRLAEGYPVGAAFEYFQDRYAETASELSSSIEEVSFGIVDDRLLADQWVGMTNARNLAIFGDPAVRLPEAVVGTAEQPTVMGEAYPAALDMALGEIGEQVVELEIDLRRQDQPGLYKMNMRLAGKGEQEGATRVVSEMRIDLESFLQIDTISLQAAGLEGADAYGKRLFAALFDQPGALALWERFVSQQERATPSAAFEEPFARLRLRIDSQATELQYLRWETLCDSRDGRFLFRAQELGFTRYLSEPDWRPLPPLRERGELRVLAAMANPRNMRDYAPNRRQLDPLDIPGEQARATQAMEGLQVEFLVGQADHLGQVSVENLERQLRKGYDVLYLVCNFVWTERTGLGLFLEGADGTAHVIRADDLVQRLRHMRVERRPRLVVLVSPPASRAQEGEGVSPLEPVAELAAPLCASGIGAVLVCPAELPVEISEGYLHAFFQALQWDGRADRAAAVARRAVYPRPGWWGPALFTRRMDGRLWSGEGPVQPSEAQVPAELFFELSRKSVTGYEARADFTWRNRENVQRMVSPVNLDFDALRAAGLDSREYGERLYHSLFGATDLGDFYRKAIDMARMSAESVRMRLLIDASAPELHRLSWERLFDPQAKAYLAMDEELAFARYLYSSRWREVERRPRGALRGLFAVANPENLRDYQLEPIDEGALRETVSNLEQEIAIKLLRGPVTMQKLSLELREGYDLFCLVCHGAYLRDESWLFLQDEEGQLERIPGGKFISLLEYQAHLPRLVVLGSGQTAPLAAILGEIGVPAVLAMLDNVSVETFNHYFNEFFTELLEDGRADRAAAVARSAVSNRTDWWSPVLYTRLRDGKIW